MILRSLKQRAETVLAKAAEAPRSGVAERRDECVQVDDSTPESNSERSVEQRRGG
jgi:hypothetical protein